MTFNGTEYTINARGHASDIVGFAWNTEEFCPRCTLGALGYASTLPVLGNSAALESAIKIYAEEGGFDSQTTDVPQAIFNGEDALDDDGRSRTCATCHEPLIEQDDIEGDE
jgi:hypothetical protein